MLLEEGEGEGEDEEIFQSINKVISIINKKHFLKLLKYSLWPEKNYIKRVFKFEKGV